MGYDRQRASGRDSGTAEKKPFSKDEFDKLLNLAAQGIDSLILAQRESLGEIAADIPQLPKRDCFSSFNEGKFRN